jgi:hypothetical protein
MTANYTEEEIKKAHEILFNEGVKMRYQVAGKEYVDTALKKRSDPFAGAMQDVRPNIPSYISSADGLTKRPPPSL